MLKIHLAELLRQLAERLHPYKGRYEEHEVQSSPVSEGFKEKRYEAALAVSEDDIEGFLLLVLKPETDNVTGGSEITLLAMVPSGAWPAFRGSMRQVETFAQEHERPEG